MCETATQLAELLSQDSQARQLEAATLKNGAKLLELAKRDPMGVIAYFHKNPEPTDPGEQHLRMRIVAIAAKALLDRPA